jgi:putative spermidine/putrescine transport system substrate-binding protein
MADDDAIARTLALMAGQSPHAADLTRRRFIAGAARFGLTAAVAAAVTQGFAMPAFAAPDEAALPKITTVPDKLKGSGEVRYCSFGGALQDAQRKAYLKPFEELTGIKVIESEGPDTVKVKAMVDSGNLEYDIYEDDLSAILNLSKKGDYYEPIDYTLFDTDNLFPSGMQKLGVNVLPYGQVIAYRTDAFGGKAPTSNKDFWDQDQFPGPRAMQSGSGGLSPDIEVAAMAAGADPKKLYPINLDQAYDSLGKIKPHVVKWWEAGAIPAQLLTDDEVVMATAWNGRIFAIQQNKAPVEIMWKDQILRNDVWAIPKGAPNKTNAQKLAAFITMAEPQARLAMLIPYGFVNKKAEALIPPDRLKVLPTTANHREDMIEYNTDWWVANTDAVLDRWKSFILG